MLKRRPSIAPRTHRTMKCIIAAALSLLVAAHSVRGLSLAPRLAAPRPALSDNRNLVLGRRRSASSVEARAAHVTRLFSATAISADGAFEEGGENLNVKYGPGKIRFRLECI